MFSKVNKTVIALAFTATLSVSGAANAAESCWGLQGQALKDCIDKVVKDICQAGGGGSTCGDSKATLVPVKKNHWSENGSDDRSSRPEKAEGRSTR